MFEFVELDVLTTTNQKQLSGWVSDCVVVDNLTPFPLYINWKTTKIPNPISYDKLIPPGMKEVFAAVGTDFGFFLNTGGSTVTAGKCNITIQADEVIPSFSQVSFKAPLSTVLSVDSGIPLFNNVLIVPASGALGISFTFTVTALSIPADTSLDIESSIDGATWTRLARYRVPDTIGSFISQILPVTGNFVRFTWQVVGIADGTLSYILLNNYTPIPPKLSAATARATSAALPAIGGTLSITGLAGRSVIRYLDVSFKTPAATPNAISFWVRMAIDNDAIDFFIRESITLPAFGISLGVGQPYLIHRRVNEWAWRIPVNMAVLNSALISLFNQSGGILTDATVAVELDIES